MNKMALIAATCTLFGITLVAQAQGDPAAGKQKAATCAACHGTDGNSTNAEWPKIAGQHEKYLVKQLVEYKSGERQNATMNGMAAPLSEQDMQDLAAYFSRQETSPGEADPELVELGEQIYRGGDLVNGISACAACHAPTGAGNPEAMFPQLAGQHALYTANQLKMFRSGERANDAGQMMRNIASKMNDRQIEAVASYIQGLRP